MTGRVILHVGTMKSGTSYLQSTLFANQDTLAGRGVLVPGATWGDQWRACLNALGRERSPEGVDLRGAWPALAQQCRDWTGTSVISMELLGTAGPKAIERTLAGLSGVEVHVVFTVRDLNRNLVAMWQEAVQNGRWWTWAEYLAAAERGRARPERVGDDITPPSRSFWGQQNPARLVRAWAGAVGPERVHVVTLPHPGAPASLLLRRFGAAVGCSLEGLVEGERANASLGAASARLLRQLNEVLAGRGVEFPAGLRVRKHDLAKNALAARAHDEPRIGLEVLPWVRQQSSVVVERMAALGVQLHGDWADLEPVPVTGIDPATVTGEAVVAAAATGHAHLRRVLAARYGGGTPAWPSQTPTPDEAVAALADLVEWSVARDPASAR